MKLQRAAGISAYAIIGGLVVLWATEAPDGQGSKLLNVIVFLALWGAIIAAIEALHAYLSRKRDRESLDHEWHQR